MFNERELELSLASSESTISPAKPPVRTLLREGVSPSSSVDIVKTDAAESEMFISPAAVTLVFQEE